MIRFLTYPSLKLFIIFSFCLRKIQTINNSYINIFRGYQRANIYFDTFKPCNNIHIFILVTSIRDIKLLVSKNKKKFNKFSIFFFLSKKFN